MLWHWHVNQNICYDIKAFEYENNKHNDELSVKIFEYTCILFAQLRQENRDNKYSMKIGQNFSHHVTKIYYIVV